MTSSSGCDQGYQDVPGKVIGQRDENVVNPCRKGSFTGEVEEMVAVVSGTHVVVGTFFLVNLKRVSHE